MNRGQAINIEHTGVDTDVLQAKRDINTPGSVHQMQANRAQRI